MNIDDTDGAGPEQISHTNPESLDYEVGAYYYGDNALGASYATVRIHRMGSLLAEYSDKYMPRTGPFWHVATISEPSGTATGNGTVTPGFPSSP